MSKTSMQEQSREKAPVLALDYNGIRLERADPVQNFRIVRVANGYLEKKGRCVKEDQYEHCRGISELAARRFVAHSGRTDCGSIVRLRFQLAK